MINLTRKEDCSGCESCYNICPNNCIHIKTDQNGFSYPYIDKSRCSNCGLCIHICPIHNNIKKVKNSKVYACINRNESIRNLSSAGGLFAVLGEYILENDGVVFGASFDENLNLSHNYAQNIEDMQSFIGSKFVQSEIGYTYRNVKLFLDKNRKVLFSGTPCEVAGLKSFLRKDYKNLLCVDIVCSGVPSPKVFNLYKKQNESDDIYISGFKKSIFLRQSCYNCRFKFPKSFSDLTLGSITDTKKICPKLSDDKGTSLLIVNSQKGLDVLKKVKFRLSFEEISFDDIIKVNPSISISSEYNIHKRKKFFKTINSCSDNICYTIQKYSKNTVYDKISTRLMNILFFLNKR